MALHRPKGRTKIVSDGIHEGFQLFVGRRQFCRALSYEDFELSRAVRQLRLRHMQRIGALFAFRNIADIALNHRTAAIFVIEVADKLNLTALVALGFER